MDLPEVRPEIAGLAPYTPGRSAAEITRELGLRDVVKLASNENPLGPSPQAVRAVQEAMRHAHVYPESASPDLRLAVAEHLGLDPAMVFAGNGSDEIFRLLAMTFLGPGRRAVVPAPSFPTYRRAARSMGAEVTEVPLRPEGGMDLPAMASAAARRAPAAGVRRLPAALMVFLCRPNNPTGGVFAAADLPDFMAALPRGCLVVLDEAYHEYDDTGFDGLAYLKDYRNLVVTRTFSKAYGLAGLRAGYAAAHPDVWQHVWTVREPFSVSAAAQAGAAAALGDRRHLEQSVVNARAGKAELRALCAELGLGYTPSQANFVLIDVRRPARAVFEHMLRQGVIVRPGDTFGVPTALRVTAGTAPELRRFAGALGEALRAAGPND